jgi:hypothetical protein
MADETAPQKDEGLPQYGPAQPSGRDPVGEAEAPRHTPGGAPTDAAHQDIGDGALTGSVPAGLTTDELRERARDTSRDVGATD